MRGIRPARPRDQVGGDLQLDEPVVRHVVVERLDDPVAVAPGFRVRLDRERVRLVLGVAGHVEPVPRPRLAVARRREQPVDDLREGVGRVVLQERLDLVGRRRQAGQVERHPADQRRACPPARPASVPSRSSFARMKRSIGFASGPLGTTGLTTG